MRKVSSLNPRCCRYRRSVRYPRWSGLSKGGVRSILPGGISVGRGIMWAKGYVISTVGRDEQVIREYRCHQEKEDRRIEQLNLV